MDETDNPLARYWMEGDSLAPPCQAEMDVVDAIIKLAELSPSHCLYDLGCGDGRICIQASKVYGCNSVGCEIEESLIKQFEANVKESSLEEKVFIQHGDLMEVDLTSATHIVLYLLPESIELLKPKLMDALENNTVIICNTWGPKDPNLRPTKRVQCGFCNNVTLLKYDKSSLTSSSSNNSNDNSNSISNSKVVKIMNNEENG